jgi:hypothetical protein
VALAEASIAAGLGVRLELPAGDVRLDRLLFAEGGARILVSVPVDRSDAWQQALDRSVGGGEAVPAQLLGEVSAEPELIVTQADRVVLISPLEPLRQSYEQALPRRLPARG